MFGEIAFHLHYTLLDQCIVVLIGRSKWQRNETEWRGIWRLLALKRVKIQSQYLSHANSILFK